MTAGKATINSPVEDRNSRYGRRSNRAGCLRQALVGACALACACPASAPSLPDSAAPGQASGSQGAALEAESTLLGSLHQELGPRRIALLARSDGFLEAQLQDQSGQPVQLPDASLTAVVEGRGEIVEIPMIPENDRFLGTVIEVEGNQDVVLWAALPGEGDQEVTFAEVTLAAAVTAPEPHFQGRLIPIGAHFMELAASAEGQVYVTVSDATGLAVSPENVQLSQIWIITPTGPRVVTLYPRGTVLLGSLGQPLPTPFAAYFDLAVGDRDYGRITLRYQQPRPVGQALPPPPPVASQADWPKLWRPDGATSEIFLSPEELLLLSELHDPDQQDKRPASKARRRSRRKAPRRRATARRRTGRRRQVRHRRGRGRRSSGRRRKHRRRRR